MIICSSLIKPRGSTTKHSMSIKIKLNSLTDIQLIDKLYDASNAGVKIQLQISVYKILQDFQENLGTLFSF